MNVFHFDTIDSTNEAAKRMVVSGEIKEPAYLLARKQTAGKGSRGRQWGSPRDAGIYLTVVEPMSPAPTASTTALTLAAGVACANALSETAGIDVRLKPINDLYYQGQKIGGILTETSIAGGVIEAVITGVGINVRKADRPVTSGAVTPVSLEEAVGAERFARIDLDRLVATLVVQIRKWQADVCRGRIADVKAAWEARKLPGTTLPAV